MGQASVELPEAPPDATGPTDVNPDDLLAKMAEDEIDRLLAEDDLDAKPLNVTPIPPPDPQPASPEAAAAPAAAATTVEAPTELPSEEVAIAQAAAAVEVEIQETIAAKQSPDDELSTQLNELFESLSDDSPAAADPASAAMEEPTSRQERDALTEPDSEDATPAAAPRGRPKRLPLFARPLAWLNAPFSFITPAARDAIGKAAIVTAVNAVAMILYVLLFRK
jgi:hypothetical protein